MFLLLLLESVNIFVRTLFRFRVVLFCMFEQCWRRTSIGIRKRTLLTRICEGFFGYWSFYQNKECIFSQKMIVSCIVLSKQTRNRIYFLSQVWFLLHKLQHMVYINDIFSFVCKNWRKSSKLRSVPHSTHVNWCLQHFGRCVAYWDKAASSFRTSCAAAMPGRRSPWSQQYTHP